MRASITKVSTTGMDLRAEFDALNPNAFELSARSVTAKVMVDGKFDLGTVTIPSKMALPARKHTRLDVPLSVRWSDLSMLAAVAATQRNLPYELEGTVEVGSDSFHVGLPFRMSGIVTQAQIVEALGRSLPKLPNMPGLPRIPGDP